MTREITHMKAFTAALESLGKDRFSIGAIPPTPQLVDQYFDDSTGMGDRGEPRTRALERGWRLANGGSPGFQRTVIGKERNSAIGK
jgi:Mn-containing catalase